MKLVTYKPAGAGPQLGVIVGDSVVNLAEASSGRLANDMRSFLEMGEEAMDLARSIERALDAERRCPTIKSVATDGTPAAWHPDLRSFEEEALELIETRD